MLQGLFGVAVAAAAGALLGRWLADPEPETSLALVATIATAALLASFYRRRHRQRFLGYGPPPISAGLRLPRPRVTRPGRDTEPEPPEVQPPPEPHAERQLHPEPEETLERS